MHSIIEFDLSNCSIHHCCIEDEETYEQYIAHYQYAVHYPQCLVVRIKGDYRDMTEQELKKRCLMEIRSIVDFHLSTLGEPCDHMTEVGSVIRCKNCKYFDDETKFPYCHYWEENTNYNDLCSRGVRCIDKSTI